MSRPDLILLHPPSIFRFRELPIFYGPISDVIPSSSLFELYPIGFLSISEYLHRHGISVRIVNIAMKMLKDNSFEPERFITKLNPLAFGIDLHWLLHVDGSLSLAEMIKRNHPEKPVVLGGLSTTYYADEIMRDYPFIDCIICGDSTEEPLRMFIETIKSGRGYDTVPNLVWRDSGGRVIVNKMSYKPENLDALNFDYSHLLRMAIKYRDPWGYIPFHNWYSYPVTAVFSCRGCYHNCASCGGSFSAFKRVCKRGRPCFRSPELLAKDIKNISEYTGAPIMVIGDILQGGKDYAERFLNSMEKLSIQNEITIEFFTPPPAQLASTIASAIKNFNVEMSPESHDPKVRQAFGKHYDNAALEKVIEALISAGCKRIDLFFMVGLPFQDTSSVMETVRYCAELLEKYGKRLLPMIAPLAPFIDPGSNIFEDPKKFGYKLFYKTLAEHRQAMLMPSWKYALNYETQWMTRNDIVMATYEGAWELLNVKARYGIIEKKLAEAIQGRIQRSMELIEKIDHAMTGSTDIDDTLKGEIFSLNAVTSLCDKDELQWPIWKRRLNLLKAFRLLLS